MTTSKAALGAVSAFRMLRMFRVIRTLRTLRVLRTIRFVANLQALMETVLESLKTLGTTALLMVFFMYLFAVVGQGLYGDIDYRFDTLPRTFWTLFELLTCDDWFFLNTAMQDKGRPHIFLFIMVYTIVLVYIFLSLLIAVLVDNFSAMLETLKAEKKAMAQCQKDDEDDDNQLLVDESESDDEVDEFDDGRTLTVDDYYKHVSSKEERDLIGRHLLLMAAVDYQMYQVSQQQRLLDVMVDMAADVSTEHV